MFLPLISDTAEKLLALHEDQGLQHRIIDIVTEGDTPADHQESFDRAVEKALTFEPLLVNSHTGRDIFSFVENLELYRHAIERSRDAGVPIVHETHRFRPTHSAVETRKYLEELPDLQLNADLSHWMVVHESDLSDQEETVDLALGRSQHIHARVGFEEGPQVNDPRAPEWSGHLERHINLWQRVIDHCRAAGLTMLAITPEIGPVPYVPTLPCTGHRLSTSGKSTCT